MSTCNLNCYTKWFICNKIRGALSSYTKRFIYNNKMREEPWVVIQNGLQITQKQQILTEITIVIRRFGPEVLERCWRGACLVLERCLPACLLHASEDLGAQKGKF